jgi:cytochrome c biogenesis protein CcmG/thiol:disulfide interchange protein DsbE
VYGIPETFLISDEGIIIIRHAGEMTHDVYRSIFLPKIEEMMQ